ncbi:ABC transporter permease [Rhizobium sp. BK060]|uniref:ABC transporter permease n=1 Tax=Rhizobium sp. BK060 TaxID=2587096 RepID=UPI0016086450|nr:ABC transporter permease [Rhizobium sp. BK060]MBB3394227.1 fructose transport system permease protein [Rhizobium sp. BK060]
MSTVETPTNNQRQGMAEYERVLAGAKTETARFEEERKPFLRRVQVFIHHNPTVVPFIILILSLIAFSVLNGTRFMSMFNFSLIMQQVSIIAIVGIAQTLIILTAGIDISIGAILVISHIVMARVAMTYGVPPYLAIGVGLLVGTACGFFNGCLVTVFRLPPFIATLGTWSIFGSLNIWYSQGETIGASQIAQTAPFLQFLGTSFGIAGARFSYGFLLVLLVAAAIWYVLAKTAFGRHVYSTGDNEEAARFAGINTRGTLLAVYTLGGFVAAVGGLVLIGRIGAASPLAGGTLNMDSVTAVVIGGTSLFGGRGSIIGTLLGALIVGVFRNGLALGGVDVVWQELSVGFLILIAVAIDQWIRKVAK